MNDLISEWVDQKKIRELAESLLRQPHGFRLNHSEVSLGNRFEGFTLDSNSSPETASLPLVKTTPAAIEPSSVKPLVKPRGISSLEGKQPKQGKQLGGKQSAIQSLQKAQSDARAGGVIAQPNQASREEKPHSVEFKIVDSAEKREPANSQLVPPPVNAQETLLNRVIPFGEWLKGSLGVKEIFIINAEGKALVDEVKEEKLIQVARILADVLPYRPEVPPVEKVRNIRISDHSFIEIVPSQSQFGVLILGMIVENPLPEELIPIIRRGLYEVSDIRLLMQHGEA